MLVALDGVWLGVIARNLYRREMGSLMAASPLLIPAAIFYAAYPLAIVYFGLAPLSSSAGATALDGFVRCAALGLAAYATYNLANLSVVQGFSVRLAIIDMAWGTFATGVSGSAAWLAVRWWTARG